MNFAVVVTTNEPEKVLIPVSQALQAVLKNTLVYVINLVKP